MTEDRMKRGKLSRQGTTERRSLIWQWAPILVALAAIGVSSYFQDRSCRLLSDQVDLLSAQVQSSLEHDRVSSRPYLELAFQMGASASNDRIPGLHLTNHGEGPGFLDLENSEVKLLPPLDGRLPELVERNWHAHPFHALAKLLEDENEGMTVDHVWSVGPVLTRGEALCLLGVARDADAPHRQALEYVMRHLEVTLV